MDKNKQNVLHDMSRFLQKSKLLNGHTSLGVIKAELEDAHLPESDVVIIWPSFWWSAGERRLDASYESVRLEDALGQPFVDDVTLTQLLERLKDQGMDDLKPCVRLRNGSFYLDRLRRS